MKVTIVFNNSKKQFEFLSLSKARTFLRSKGSWRKSPQDSWRFEYHDTLSCWNIQTDVMATLTIVRDQ